MDVEGVLNESSGAVQDRRFRAEREARCDSCSGQTELCSGSPDQQRGVFTPRYQNVGPNRSRAALTLRDTELNPTAEGPAEPPECSAQSRVTNWPLSLEQRSHVQKGSGNASNGAFASLLQPQRTRGADQRAADASTMTSSSHNQPCYRRPGRVVFLEDDPYYVTMYHPGSVYVGE